VGPCLLATPPLAASLSLSEQVRSCLPAWVDLGASGLVKEWIRYGYRIPFSKQVLPFRQRCCPPSSPAERVYMVELVQRLSSLGAIEPALSPDFVSKSRLVPKKDGGFRLVVDLRHINSHFPTKPCKFETLLSLENQVRPGDWFFSLDLKDGYYHLSIHPSHRKFVTTELNGVLYQFVGLPFGLSSAPRVFTKVMRVFVRALRVRGIRVLPYLDDFLIVSASRVEALLNRVVVQDLMVSLGLSRNMSKGMWEPAQSVVHLGIGVDSVRNLFFVPEDKLAIVKAAARSLVTYAASHRRWVHHQRLESFVGFAMSLVVALQQVRTRTRSLYDALANRRSSVADCRLSAVQLADLQWFVDLDGSWNGLPLLKPVPTVTVLTDASDFGWGALVQGGRSARGFFSPEETLRHITYKELYAVHQALRMFPGEVRRRSVSLLVDNQAAMAVVNKGSSRSPVLMSLCRVIQAQLRELGVYCRATYIRSADNVEADRLSRVIDPTDWSVSEGLWKRIVGRFGKPSVDRFATAANARCLAYNSMDYDPVSLGDCFLADWEGRTNWINPPWAVIPRLIAKVIREQAPSILLLPRWESAPWWPLVIHHSSILWEIPDAPASFVVPSNPATPQPLRNIRWRLIVSRMF